MKPLFGNELVQELRKRADAIKSRLWICVPYLGKTDAVLKILGKNWLENEAVEVRLLTDVSDMRAINSVMLKSIHERGDVKTLAGVHAKIYILDDSALITSANLTETAFSKRYEIGIFLDDVSHLTSIFENWWMKAEKINLIDTAKIYEPAKEKDEVTAINLPKIWDLPKSPEKVTKKKSEYTNYDRILIDFDDFAEKYQKVQRIWEDDPIYLEIDGLFNYLFHEDTAPSNDFYKLAPRVLSEAAQMKEIQKWSRKYKNWNDRKEQDDIEWRRSNVRSVQRLLSKRKIETIQQAEIEEILGCLNSMNSYAINKTRVINNNSVQNIREAFSILIYGTGTVASRISTCEKSIKFFGKSSTNELIACFYPDKYPLVNQNSISGLRFFGYQSKM
jgi:phosphatidylserine/phosphatidylglycerophosphate/cardiolipin synthase-like enzyme